MYHFLFHICRDISWDEYGKNQVWTVQRHSKLSKYKYIISSCSKGKSCLKSYEIPETPFQEKLFDFIKAFINQRIDEIIRKSNHIWIQIHKYSFHHQLQIYLRDWRRLKFEYDLIRIERRHKLWYRRIFYVQIQEFRHT